MGTVYLRELISSGFCGRRIWARGGKHDRSHTHIALDKILTEGAMKEDVASESGAIQAANRYGIPFEEHDYFLRCLSGLTARWDRFRTAKEVDVDVSDRYDLDSGSVIRMTSIVEENGVLVEPYYGVYTAVNHYPMHAIAAALLSGQHSGTVSVRTIPAFGGEEIFSEYPIDAKLIHSLISEAMSRSDAKPGWACGSCQVENCHAYAADSFGQSVVRWLELKKEIKRLESEIHEHLSMKGPTQVGAHVIHLKPHKRRFFDDKKFQDLYTAVLAKCPKTHMEFFNPDAAAIFAAIERGDLPAELKKFFRESSYFTIEGSMAP